MQASQASRLPTATTVKAGSLPTVLLSPSDLMDVGGCLLLPQSISAKVQAHDLQVCSIPKAANLI